MKLRILVAVLIVAAAVASWQLLQQTEPIVLPTPARILARMVLIEGDVKLRKAGTLGWILPALPAPLQTNDSIRTGDRSAAEIDFPDRTRLRTRPGSLFTMEEQPNHPRQVEPYIKSGEVAFRTGPRPETGISSPSSRIVPSPDTEGRIQVSKGGTEIEVSKGEAQVETESGQFLQVSPSDGAVRVDPEGRAVEPPRDALLEALSPLPLSLSVLELKGNQLYVKGRTDRGATVTVNGERLTVQRDGSFDEHVVLEEHVLEVVIRATGLDGAATEQRVPVSRLLLRRL